LLEKNIDGTLIDKLDLQSLLYGDLDDEDTEEHHCLRLMFDHVRKDRRERRFIMESEKDKSVSLSLSNIQLLHVYLT
jgi:hypothetical protein